MELALALHFSQRPSTIGVRLEILSKNRPLPVTAGKTELEQRMEGWQQ